MQCKKNKQQQRWQVILIKMHTQTHNVYIHINEFRIDKATHWVAQNLSCNLIGPVREQTNLPQVVKIILVTDPLIIGQEAVGLARDVFDIVAQAMVELAFEQLLRQKKWHSMPRLEHLFNKTVKSIVGYLKEKKGCYERRPWENRKKKHSLRTKEQDMALKRNQNK